MSAEQAVSDVQDEILSTVAEIRALDEVLGAFLLVYGGQALSDEQAAMRVETVLDLRDVLRAAQQRAYALGHPEDTDARYTLTSWRRGLTIAWPAIETFTILVSRDDPVDLTEVRASVAGLLTFGLLDDSGTAPAGYPLN